jgi:hypothetical protein
MTAKSLPWAVRGGVLLTSALLGAGAWLITRGLVPAARLGSEVIRRPVDWVFHVLLASLGFWRQAALDNAVLRWGLLVLPFLYWLAWGYGYTVLVLAGSASLLALGAVLGLWLEHSAHKVRREIERQSSGTD